MPFPRTGSSRTPLEKLQCTRTPNGLHFERHHNGIPDIDPAKYELLVHGLVRQPLLVRYDDLLRYPRYTRTLFLECSGNSGTLAAPEPAQASAEPPTRAGVDTIEPVLSSFGFSPAQPPPDRTRTLGRRSG
ncbi:molybdopterin-dependent oxidoreductase [Sphingomonas sp.]|uniref:molybdopterin-dependent oxidoreductase n=1 Tax=Sphingomonas sp. TaxID=28214 RepID=UPI003917FDC4